MGLLGLQVQVQPMESQMDDPKQLHKALDFGEIIIIIIIIIYKWDNFGFKVCGLRCVSHILILILKFRRSST